jgi:hypothetical protein
MLKAWLLKGPWQLWIQISRFHLWNSHKRTYCLHGFSFIHWWMKFVNMSIAINALPISFLQLTKKKSWYYVTNLNSINANLSCNLLICWWNFFATNFHIYYCMLIRIGKYNFALWNKLHNSITQIMINILFQLHNCMY